MIFVLIVIGVFVAASLYFFFRAESLQREVIVARKEVNNANKENKALVDSMVTVANCYDEFAKKRFGAIKSFAEKSKNEQLLSRLELVNPLIQNYAAIYRETSKGPGRLKVCTKKCYDSYQENSFKEFIAFIGQQDKSIQRMWSSDNLRGFISLTESLLALLEHKRAGNNT